jgi:two-component system response regulator FlrC
MPRAAVNAIRAGAKEYIPLPPDAELIAAVLAAVARESTDFSSATRPWPASSSSPTRSRLRSLVLITGESGTGKEVMARYVHARSRRGASPSSRQLRRHPRKPARSELFGHEKGAFTGAVARRIGKFEEASGGTLLLDEISEMDVRLQAKLLRAIQERVIDRVGGTKPVPVDIRIIATSNRNLAEAVRDGTLPRRPALRLNVVNLRIPPLRERPATSRTRRAFRPRNTPRPTACRPPAAVAEAKRVLQGHAPGAATSASWKTPCTAPCCWPRRRDRPRGDRHARTAARPTRSRHAAVAAAGGGPRPPKAITRALVGRTVADVERDLILDTLDHCLGNRTHAANILGISIRTLRNKLNEYSDRLAVPAPGTARIATRRGLTRWAAAARSDLQPSRRPAGLPPQHGRSLAPPPPPRLHGRARRRCCAAIIALADRRPGDLVVLIVPLPPLLLDMLLAVSIIFSVLILMTALFIQGRWNSRPSRPCC